MSRDTAQSELDDLKRLDPSFSAYLQRYTLDQLYPIIESATQQSSENGSLKFLFPIVNEVGNTDSARSLLLSEGVPADVIDKNLRIPVFYTEPMINMSSPGQDKKRFFFMEYSSLTDALAIISSDPSPKLKVLNLDQVLEIIIEEKDDVFSIYPNAQYSIEASE
jgi:hypothetical protein